MNIQWFPGHMTKAIRQMEDSLRLVDALIYVIDARAVAACINPLFSRLTTGKKVLYVFNKCDLVNKNELALWETAFDLQGKKYVTAVGTSGDCSQIVKGLKTLMSEKLERFAKKGAAISIRAMVVGVPNSGKSTIINSMIKRAKAVTGNRPGVTRGKQWLSVDGVDFLDTPGTLWGKFEDQSVAHHLAYIGSIKDDVLDTFELACDFVSELKIINSGSLCERYGISEIDKQPYEVLDDIAKRRGFKLREGEFDTERAARALLDDFRKGRLGKLMLEKPI